MLGFLHTVDRQHVSCGKQSHQTPARGIEAGDGGLEEADDGCHPGPHGHPAGANEGLPLSPGSFLYSFVPELFATYCVSSLSILLFCLKSLPHRNSSLPARTNLHAERENLKLISFRLLADKGLTQIYECAILWA